MALYKEIYDKRMKPRCLMCEGDLEKANLGSVCNVCKDKFLKK